MQPIAPTLLSEIAFGPEPTVMLFAMVAVVEATSPVTVAPPLTVKFAPERSPVASTSPVTVAPPLKVAVPVTDRAWLTVAFPVESEMQPIAPPLLSEIAFGAEPTVKLFAMVAVVAATSPVTEAPPLKVADPVTPKVEFTVVGVLNCVTEEF